MTQVFVTRYFFGMSASFCAEGLLLRHTLPQTEQFEFELMAQDGFAITPAGLRQPVPSPKTE